MVIDVEWIWITYSEYGRRRNTLPIRTRESMRIYKRRIAYKWKVRIQENQERRK